MGRHPALDLTFALGPGAGTLQDMLYAELDAFEPVAIQEHERGDGWRVFFRSAADRNAARSTLAAEFGNALPHLRAIEVDDEDWARRSQASLTAIHVGRIVVVPPWDLPIGSDLAANRQPPGAASSSANSEQRTASSDIVIVIDPSTGFGTGHHASTRLCLELLQKVDLNGLRVIDVGTGSGVLALAAWKLGASHVIAIDNDPDALDNARDNVRRNGGKDAITISEIDLSSASLEPADIVIANLTGALLQRHAGSLRRLLVSNGALIVAGFTGEERENVAEAFNAHAKQTAQEGDWVALMFDLLPEGGTHT